MTVLTNAQDATLEVTESENEHLVQPPRFASLNMTRNTQSSANSIEILYDVSLHVSVELGRTDMTIRDILSLGVGSVVGLTKLAGEPVDILINGKPIARGEVVVIDDKFGVRVMDILSPQDRINSLR
ncbi:MAG: flagellar motor switch protein FliN [Anaerolineae bacterium]|nr:flagellar motor switch protein FliN [Anaerolineae bacterium]